MLHSRRVESVASKVKKEFARLANPRKAKLLAGFFKTGKGEYAEGDEFWGVMVPDTRCVVTRYAEQASLSDIKNILKHGKHEERLCALLMLVAQFETTNTSKRKTIFDFYLSNTQFINNWDLVDVTTPRIVGAYLLGKPKGILRRLARSKNMWERRIAILATFPEIGCGQCSDALAMADRLMNDKHDLIHKATGWMLREVGKKCGEKVLLEYLLPRRHNMPRTMLRYAIERLSKRQREMLMRR
ncbi:DNA alkylation repair protein [Patescibacteria group bacterium]|nr:MAG: DNA alkylation repair protein [Patescibacteria group bacterium]